MRLKVSEHATFIAIAIMLTLISSGVTAKEEHCMPAGASSSGAEFIPSESQLSVLDRLTGFWRGEGFGGMVEEWWSPRDGQEMFGVFRGSHEGQTDFYEFMKISPWEKGYIQTVRHMNAEGAPWVYKPVDTQFRLIAIDDECIQFDGVAYGLNEDGGLTVTVLVGSGSSGETSIAIVQFSRTAVP